MGIRPGAADSPSDSPPIIRLCAVEKSYALGRQRIQALRGLDLEIQTQGFYAIMGPSGSGKSTLLHLMGGLDRPDAGTIEIAGERIDHLDESQLTLFRRHRIGIVFQQYNLISTLTALDNVTLPALLDRMPAPKRDKRGRALLEALGLGHRMDHRPDALSGGEQQRVAIARALFFEPAVVLADEPTGNVDSTTAEQLWSLLRDLAEQRSITLIMVTHEPSAAVHCHRVFRLRDGRIDDSFVVDGMDVAELATRVQRTGG